jgi:DNA-binding HxlR family transcriptional regulator
MKSLADYGQKIDRLQDDCPVRAALDVVRGRWKPSILFELKSGPKRFSQIQSALRGITAQALTVQLRQLEADGVIERKIFPEVPPRVENTLSEDGQSMSAMMDQLEVWGIAYLARRRGRKTKARV